MLHLLSLALIQLVLQHDQLGLELIHLLPLCILLLLLAELHLDLLKLSSLPVQSALFFLIYLPFEGEHLLLQVDVLLAELLFLFIGLVHFGLQFDHFNVLLSEFSSQHVQRALLYLELVGVELLVGRLELVLQVLGLVCCTLLIVLQLILFFLEFLLDVYYFFLLVGHLAAYFVDLVLELLLELNDSLFPPLQVKSLLSERSVQLIHGSHAFIEVCLSLLFLLFPRKSDFFDLLDLSLLEIGLELGLLRSLPHLQLPDRLVLLLWVSPSSFWSAQSWKVGAKAALSLRIRLRPLFSGSREALRLPRSRFRCSCVFEIQKHSKAPFELASLTVFDVMVPVVNADLRHRCLLQRSGHQSVQRNVSLADFVVATLDLVHHLDLEGVLGENLRQFILCCLEIEGAEAIPELGLLHLILADAGRRRGLEIMSFLQFQLVLHNDVCSNLHILDAE